MPDRQAERNHPPELRLLHWNIHSWRDEAGGSNLEAVAGLIQSARPHIVSLVEVDENWQTPSTLDMLAERWGYISIFVPAFEFGVDQPRGGFGNALLTQLPILAVRQRQLVWPVPTYDGTEPSEPRSLLLIRVSLQGKPVWVGSTHLPRGDARTREQALQRLKIVADELEEPWVLCGDFNAPAAAWLKGASNLTAWPDPLAATYPTEEPTEAIDYLVTPAGFRVEAEVLMVRGADHLPVAGTIGFEAST